MLSVYQAVFNKQHCIRSRANELWLKGSSQTADQDWLQAESEVLSLPLIVVIWTKDIKGAEYGYIDKTRRVADVNYSDKGLTIIDDKRNVVIVLNDQRLSCEAYVIGTLHHTGAIP